MDFLKSTMSVMDLDAVPFDPTRKISKDLVHKQEECNVVISNIRKVESADGDFFECAMAFDDSLPFFFEHYLDHIPGLLIIEGVRQMGVATLHKFFDVSSDFSFVLDSVTCEFLNYVELHSPVQIQMRVTEVSSGKACSRRRQFNSNLTVWQLGQCRAKFTLGGTCLSPKLIARLRAAAAKCAPSH